MATVRTERRNRLILALPQKERAAVESEATKVSLSAGDVLAEAAEPYKYGFFPEEGVVSLVTVLDDGSMIEAGTVGNEGVVGLPVVLGADNSPNMRAVSQVSGESLRIPAQALVRLNEDLPGFRALMLRYAHVLLVQATQAAVCNRRHPVEARAAKWLLVLHDRIEGDVIRVTQEFLSQMLGVRRASVTEVANDLREKGLIEYRRGVINALDRPGLEMVACFCYEQIRDEFDSFLASAQALGSTAGGFSQTGA